MIPNQVFLSHALKLMFIVPLRNVGGLHVDLSSKFMADLAKRQRWRYAKTIIEGTSTLTDTREQDLSLESRARRNLLDRLTDIEIRAQQDKKIPEKELQESFVWAGTHLYVSSQDEFFLVRKLVSIPFRILTSNAIEFGISIWVWISRARPSVHARLFAEIAKNWEWALRRRKGLFNTSLKYFIPSFFTDVVFRIRFPRQWSISQLICNDESNMSTTSKKHSLLIY
jgi:phosphatidylinositol 4-kinase A